LRVKKSPALAESSSLILYYFIPYFGFSLLFTFKAKFQLVLLYFCFAFEFFTKLAKISNTTPEKFKFACRVWYLFYTLLSEIFFSCFVDLQNNKFIVIFIFNIDCLLSFFNHYRYFISKLNAINNCLISFSSIVICTMLYFQKQFVIFVFLNFETMHNNIIDAFTGGGKLNEGTRWVLLGQHGGASQVGGASRDMQEVH
jgi:hypothetical protein